MAASTGGYTTGAGKDAAELRQRNVTSYEKANGQQVYKVEAEDVKKLQKVGSHPSITTSGLADTRFQPKKTGVLQVLDDWEFLIAPIIFTGFALFTRLWRIGLSPIVTWDEAQ
jgi:dolichyl-phosphate-mannose-protein mannosyltransferase